MDDLVFVRVGDELGPHGKLPMPPMPMQDVQFVVELLRSVSAQVPALRLA
jgi:ribosomal protein L1